MIEPELLAEIQKSVVAEFEARRVSSPTRDQVAVWEKEVRALKWKAAWCLLGAPMALVPSVVIVLVLNPRPEAVPYMALPGVLSVIASGFLCRRFYHFENLRSRRADQGP